jgi:hypothetical protein
METSCGASIDFTRPDSNFSSFIMPNKELSPVKAGESKTAEVESTKAEEHGNDAKLSISSVSVADAEVKSDKAEEKLDVKGEQSSELSHAPDQTEIRSRFAA